MTTQMPRIPGAVPAHVTKYVNGDRYEAGASGLEVVFWVLVAATLAALLLVPGPAFWGTVALGTLAKALPFVALGALVWGGTEVLDRTRRP